MSKSVKSALKEAKELLKQKDHAGSIKICKKVLKEDNNNYAALVLLAAAMREDEALASQAPLALKKAINVQPENPLAWQGLVAIYEKDLENVENLMELIPAYCKLLLLHSNDTKFENFLQNIRTYTLRLNDDKVIDETITVLKKLQEEWEGEKVKEVNITLATILSNKSNVSSSDLDTLEKSLALLVASRNVPGRLEYYKQYLKLLYKSKKLSALFVSAAAMFQEFPQEIYPLEWICKVYYEENALKDCDGVEDIQTYYQTLLKLDPHSKLALLANAAHLKQCGNFTDAREILNHVVSLKPQYLHAWMILAEINSRLQCWGEAEIAATEALELLSPQASEEKRLKLKLILIESLIKSENKKKIARAIEECDQVEVETTTSEKLLQLRARAYVYSDHPNAMELLRDLEDTKESKVLAMILRASILMKKNQLEEAVDILGSALETAEAWLLLGRIHWQLSDYSHSLMAFLKGVYADPYNWECLVFLGRYYRERGNDLERSRKCYQKALQINPNSEEAGVGLSTAFRLLKNSEANVQLLQRVTSRGGGPKWAWLQLGLQQLDAGNSDEAIKALRHVIRADPNDNHCWESLADAYWARGAYTSALKSYQRALDLSPNALYPMIQLANINLVIGELEEAKVDFERVLKQEQHYVPALKGLAETCLGLAKECFRKQRLSRAREHIQQALDCLTDAIVERSNLSCLWKLLGDACYRVTSLPEKYCFLDIVPGLMTIQSNEKTISIRKKDLFALSSRSYCRALSVCRDSPLLWHDLACCYLAQIKLYPDNSLERKEILGKSSAAAKQAVKLCPGSWYHWNLLGVISMTKEIKNYALAQHCFVMAIDIESNNAVPWTNLGVLYLSLGDLRRANDAFSYAQRGVPEYMNCWLGQALIADKVDRREAFDLFRHSIDLQYHDQAALGYSNWVLKILLDQELKKDPLFAYSIVNMHAIPVATDALTWYTVYNPNDSCALNSLGLLLERQRLYRSAVQCFSKALAENDKYSDTVKVNLSRVLLQLERYSEAVELCRTVKNTDFNTQCHLALSLFKAERYEESYNAYEEALNRFSNTDSDKAHVLCAMAAMAYMFQDVDDVKTLLFQCIQIQPPVMSGLLAAAALGILHGDGNLTALVLKELSKNRDLPEYRHHVSILTAYSCLARADIGSAMKVLCKALHRYPDDVGCWVSLVKLLLESKSAAFANCAQKALFLGRNSSEISVAHIAGISSLSRLMTSSDGLRFVQKSLFAFPASIESWGNLVAALLPSCLDNDTIPNAPWLKRLISILRHNFKTTKPMMEWLSRNEDKISSISEDIIMT